MDTAQQAIKVAKIDRKRFYDRLRGTKIFPSLKQTQVGGIEAIFNKWDISPKLTDLRWLAYMLATTYHETGQKMTPCEEIGKGAGRPYGKKIKQSGRSYDKPDKLYYGRGNVQATWFENYEKMGKLLGVDLLNFPEKALDQNIAVAIMFEGMTKGDSNFGDFTGRCLEQYFSDTVNDPIGARKIINGTDRAELIAGYHKQFLSCLI